MRPEPRGNADGLRASRHQAPGTETKEVRQAEAEE